MRASLLASVLLVLCSAATGCDSTSDDEATFGDPYTVLVTDDSPVVSEDGRLAVTVEYRGSCDNGNCEQHTFLLRSRLAGDLAEVWWVHDARGDEGDSLLTAPVQAALPGTVTDAERIVLLTPDGQALDL